MSEDARPDRSPQDRPRAGELALGRLLFDRFRLIAAPDREDSLIGQGGMGVIHLAEDTLLDRIVAIKIPPHNVIFDDDAKLDLLVETRQALALTHPNIVRIYDFHESVRDELWGISMQFVPGTNLSELRTKLSLGSRSRVAFSAERIRPWVRQICEALVHAHEFAGLVHRDLNPKNIMLETRLAPGEQESREHILITDFGIAASIRHSMQRSGDRDSQTMDGAGTLPYMPWEQIMGDRPSTSNDVYALGATIYDLLTTRPPFFDGATNSILTQIERATPPSLVERRSDLHLEMPDTIPTEWEELVRDCLRKDPSDRPGSIREVADRLGFDLPPPSSSPVPSGGETRDTGTSPRSDQTSPTKESYQTTHSTRGQRTDSKRLSVVMFTDIVGSVALQQRLGTRAYADFVEQHDLMIQAALSQAEEAEILSDTGDGFLLRFGDPSEAVETALRLQFLAHRTLVEGRPIGIRVGIHLGVITELQERIGGETRRVGMALNLAARVMDIANGGQILVTRAVFDDARQYVREHPKIDGFTLTPEVVWMIHGDYLFKGSDEPLAIFEVGAEGIAPLCSPGDGLKGKKVTGSGSDQIFPSLPEPTAIGETGAAPADPGELESQRESLEKAHRELQAEIERLKISESERDQELKLQADQLSRERARLEQVSTDLAARRDEEVRKRQELEARADDELLEAKQRSEELTSALAAKKVAFESELEQRAEEMETSAQRTLGEFEQREREIIEREHRLAAERSPKSDPAIDGQLAKLRGERDGLRQQVQSQQVQLEEERREFIHSQEEEQQRANQRSTQEAKLKDQIHAAALRQLQETLAAQEAELAQQSDELELAEEQISQAATAGRSRPGTADHRVEQLDLEAHRYANRIVQLNHELAQIEKRQKRRLIAIAIASVMIATLVGIVSAKLIWGFWPWKLLEASAVPQPNLVLEGLRRLENDANWSGLLAATIPAAGDLPADGEHSGSLLEFVHHAEHELAAPPAGRAWESDPAGLLMLLEQIGGTGWDLPPAHGFLIGKAHIIETLQSPRLAGIQRTIDSYVAYQANPAANKLSDELDVGMTEIFTTLRDLLSAPDVDPLPEEAAIRQALAEIPSEYLQKFPQTDLIEGIMRLRHQLRQRPPKLQQAIQTLDKLAAQNPDWKIHLQPHFDHTIVRLGSPDSPTLDPALLIDTARRWDDPVILTSALERLESDDPAYSQILTGLWEEFYRKRSEQSRRQLPDDTAAWISRLALTRPEQATGAVKQLEDLAERGNAKAMYFLVEHILWPVPQTSRPLQDLESIRRLAAEALEKNETGSLVQLGIIESRIAQLEAGAATAAPAEKAARNYFRRAIKECQRRTDREMATMLLAGLLSKNGSDGSASRQEMAEVFFKTGTILSRTDLPLAIRNWDKARDADASATRDLLNAQIESANSAGNTGLEKALTDWWETVR